MKKLIVLILIIAIPFGLKFTESSKKPLLNRVEKDGFSKQPKDSLWEYVKYEKAKGRVNLNYNYAERYQEPILLNVKNATVKDSLAIVALIKELKELFPLKQVTYFSDYVGKDFKKFNRHHKGMYESTYNGESYDEIMSYTIHLEFDPQLKQSGRSTTSSDISINYYINPRFRSVGWNMFNNLTTLVFGFKDGLSIEDRKAYISYHFFELFWENNSRVSISDIQISPLSRIDLRKSIVAYHETPPIIKVADGFIKDDRFLLVKMFSKDFKKQFENYMYKTYPWRYVNLYLDKDFAKQKAIIVVAFMGVLILILSFSLFWNRKFKHPFLNYFLPIVVFGASYMSLNLLYGYLIHIDFYNNSTVEIIIFVVVSLLLSIGISFLLWKIEKKAVFQKGGFGYQLIFKLMLTLIMLNLPLIVGVIYHYQNTQVSFIILPYLFASIGLTLGRGLLLYLNHYSDNLIKEKDVELSRLKQVNAEAEVRLLQSQINPHFLYNALNSIASLALVDGEKTQKMTYSLSNLFKYSINRKGKKMSTIGDEIKMVQNYLDIEKIRFGDRLQFAIEVDKELEIVEIPLFVIQPLVENAIKHGVSKIEGKGEILLKIEKIEKEINITVKDSGPAFSEGLVNGHGLQTVYDLLKLSYGEQASLSWQNTPEKNIQITIPL